VLIIRDLLADITHFAKPPNPAGLQSPVAEGLDGKVVA
jgi:hypothetical protein